MNKQQLSEDRINHILDRGNQVKNNIIINLEVDQALIMMLSITHYFKFEMDNKLRWYSKHSQRMNDEHARYMNEQGISNWKDEIKWIQENGPIVYNMCIEDLLLRTLLIMNGSNYRTHDRDYDWEEKFENIFCKMPYGNEFDIAMIKFLLLPIYNAAHETNYKIV